MLVKEDYFVCDVASLVNLSFSFSKKYKTQFMLQKRPIQIYKKDMFNTNVIYGLLYVVLKKLIGQ